VAINGQIARNRLRINDLRLRKKVTARAHMAHDHALGNNPMVGATVACAVAVEEAMK